jgi:hypothetical protein
MKRRHFKTGPLEVHRKEKIGRVCDQQRHARGVQQSPKGGVVAHRGDQQYGDEIREDVQVFEDRQKRQPLLAWQKQRVRGAADAVCVDRDIGCGKQNVDHREDDREARFAQTSVGIAHPLLEPGVERADAHDTARNVMATAPRGRSSIIG